MRKTLAVFLLITLGACSQAPEEADTGEETPYSVSFFGELGNPHFRSFEGDIPDNREESIDVEGEGREVVPDATILYTAASFTDRGQVLVEPTGPVLGKAEDAPIDVVGITEGSRVLQINPQETGAEIVVIDIHHTTAQGEEREIAGTASITVGDDGAPTLGSSEPVEQLSTSIAIRGAGAQVAADDHIYLQYSLYEAETGELIDTTWPASPILLELEGTMEGLQTGIAEAPVGSRLLIQIPAHQAQGTDDLIAIVDILAVHEDEEVDDDMESEPTSTSEPTELSSTEG